MKRSWLCRLGLHSWIAVERSLNFFCDDPVTIPLRVSMCMRRGCDESRREELPAIDGSTFFPWRPERGRFQWTEQEAVDLRLPQWEARA